MYLRGIGEHLAYRVLRKSRAEVISREKNRHKAAALPDSARSVKDDE